MTILVLLGLALMSVAGISAYYGDNRAKAWFAFNFVGSWALLTMVFGYPGFIVPLLVVVAGMFVMLIIISRA